MPQARAVSVVRLKGGDVAPAAAQPVDADPLRSELGGCRGVRGLVQAAVVQPIHPPVPADDLAYLRRKGCAKLAFRTLRRRLQFAAGGQHRHLQLAIDRGWRRLLWVHVEAPQLGDTLMDLAPRSLLVAHGLTVDVYTAPHLADALRGDRWIGRCIAAPLPIDADRYDAVVVSSHRASALAPKRRWAPDLPWVSIAGEYSAPDYHRGLLATRRLADLLQVRLTDAELAHHSRQKLVPTAADLPQHTGRLALALGGVRAERTYQHWPEVVSLLAEAGWKRFVLVGSANGSEMASRVRREAAQVADIEDLAGRADIQSTRRALQGCAAALCADGGLLHLALTTGIPVVALFGAAVMPSWRLPLDFVGAALQSTTDVNGLSAFAVASALAETVRLHLGHADAPPTG